MWTCDRKRVYRNSGEGSRKASGYRSERPLSNGDSRPVRPEDDKRSAPTSGSRRTKGVHVDEVEKSPQCAMAVPEVGCEAQKALALSTDLPK